VWTSAGNTARVNNEWAYYTRKNQEHTAHFDLVSSLNRYTRFCALQCHLAHRASCSIAPFILNLSTRWSGRSHTPTAFTPTKASEHLNRRLSCPWGRYAISLGGGEEASCPCREWNNFSDVRSVAQLLYRPSHPSRRPHIGREHVSPPLQEQVFNAAYINTTDFRNHTSFRNNLWSNCSVPM